MNKQPHIITVLSDEHFGGAMSHLGDPNVHTPNMDALAAEGVSFNRAYANCPICTPSRGSIFSGRHAHAGPVQGFFDTFKATSPSAATILAEAGYHSAYFGRWHCGAVRDQTPPVVRATPKEYPGVSLRTPEHLRAGFHDWFGFEVNNAPFRSFYYSKHDENPTKMQKYQTDALTDLAIEYLNAYDRDVPLYLVLSVEPPHFPLEVEDKWQRLGDGSTLQVRPNFEDTPQMRQRLAKYYAMIENLDWNIGRLREAMQQLPPFRDNTAFAYISDHGDHMGSHGAFERKEHPHEESVRIPAIFHLPGVIPSQGQRGEFFSLVDYLPTVLGLADVVLPTHLQGRDFSPALRNEAFTGPEEILLEMVGNPRWNLDFVDWRGLVTRQWKYAFYETGHEVLFNLEEDPFELDNVAQAQPDEYARLREQTLRLLADTREPYFDVLMQFGAPMQTPIKDVSEHQPARLAPLWEHVVSSNHE